jgi:hypothetical protein
MYTGAKDKTKFIKSRREVLQVIFTFEHDKIFVPEFA